MALTLRLGYRAESLIGCSQQRSVLIQNYGDRNLRQYGTQPPFLRKRPAEVAVLQFRKYFQNDPARKVHPTIRENAQRQIPRLCAKRIDPPIEHFHTYRTRARQRVLRDFARGSSLQLLECRMNHGRIEKLVQLPEPTPRKYFFARNPGQPLLQKPQKLNFALRARRKIGGTAF